MHKYAVENGPLICKTDGQISILVCMCNTYMYTNLIYLSLFAAVAGIRSITNHSLFGAPLKLTYPSSPVQQASPGPSKIWLTEVPSILVNEIDYLRLLLERIVGEELPFSITQVNGTTLLLEFIEDVHLSERGKYMLMVQTILHALNISLSNTP